MFLEEDVRQLKETVQHLKDRQNILDCIVREARGRDRHDAELTASCYWPEGMDEHGPVPFSLAEYPQIANRGHAAGFAANQHNIANHTCEIHGDTATCESYVIGGLLSLDGATCKLAMGRYIDHLERRNGEWRILWRRSTVEMVAEGDASWLQSDPVQGFIKGTRDRSDVSYQRPVRVGENTARW